MSHGDDEGEGCGDCVGSRDDTAKEWWNHHKGTREVEDEVHSQTEVVEVNEAKTLTHSNDGCRANNTEHIRQPRHANTRRKEHKGNLNPTLDNNKKSCIILLLETCSLHVIEGGEDEEEEDHWRQSAD